MGKGAHPAFYKRYTGRKYNHLTTFLRRKELGSPFRKRVVAFLPDDIRHAAAHTRKRYGEMTRNAYTENVIVRGFPWKQCIAVNNIAAEHEMASTSTETVALTLRELTMCPEDQDGLTDFLTDYFGCSEPDELDK